MATFVRDYLKNHDANQLIRLIGSKIDKRYTVQMVDESESKYAYILYAEDTYDFYWVKLWINWIDEEIVVMSSVITTNDQTELNTYTFTYGSSIEQLVDFYDDQMFEVKKSIFKQKEYSIIKRKSEMNKDFV